MRHAIGFVGLALALVGLASPVSAQDPPQGAGDVRIDGSGVYKTYCAVCHGTAAKGDGPLADSLRVRPTDLTLLARKSGGTFPKDQVTRTVDGRKPAKGHGGADMPVWGDAFRRAQDGYSEAAVKEKIEAVVDYLGTIQKP